MILIAILVPAAGVAAQDAAGCEGLQDYGLVLMESRAEFADSIGEDIESFTEADWTAFKESAGRWREDLDAMTVTEWIQDWHRTQLAVAALYESIGSDASSSEAPNLESYEDQVNAIVAESEAAADEAIALCRDFQTLLLAIELLTGEVDSPIQTIQDLALSSAMPGIVTYDYPGGLHSSEDVIYSESPPVGGYHNPAWQNCGFYDAPVRDEHVVHSLEHGAVWITYRPELSADEVELLRTLADTDNYLLISPYEDQTAQVVATAWNHQVGLTSASDPALATFIAQFVQGPQTPELGAVCSGGISTTVETP